MCCVVLKIQLFLCFHAGVVTGNYISVVHESRTIVQGRYRNGDKYQACGGRVMQLPNSSEILCQELVQIASEKEQEVASKNTSF